ncbi:hypothetical protein AC249_AIPGENE19295 [Exaiptasia diaphana]|nr:hypothetical protein AC249_AIPGENE19295 [Exaiptasia diaphana]
MRLVVDQPECWNGPPPFRKTVERMRAMLNQKFGTPENWTSAHFMAQQTYFRLLFKLVDDKDKKRRAGGLFRYFKVSRLSAKNWELASTIMDKIEAGSLSKNKRKRNGQTVYQSSFSCLDRLDVSTQDDIIADVLTQYPNNKHEEAMVTAENCGPPKKQKTCNTEAQHVSSA